MAGNPLKVLVTGAAGFVLVSFVPCSGGEKSAVFACSREMDHAVLLQKILVVSFIVALFWKIIRYMCNLLDVEKEPVRVLVTGAAGKAQILHISFGFSFIH
ncbi:unnamed protein product [Dovyalis caffra]|uniref:Uncharacterized protein n=1 Tax=Dovyalis caffra TaxID=77055 RepID=A0AAV1SCF1_9ROSI|nr:unnamed protein product [Dovyalis caffra]